MNKCCVFSDLFGGWWSYLKRFLSTKKWPEKISRLKNLSSMDLIIIFLVLAAGVSRFLWCFLVVQGLIKGNRWLIVSLNKALFPGGGGIGGVPLDSHDPTYTLGSTNITARKMGDHLIEDVWTPLKMGIFQPAMLLYWKVLVWGVTQKGISP